MIAVGSMWRDSAAYIDRSLHQFDLLRKELDAKGEDVRFIWVENDSTDDTYERLAMFDGDVTLERRSDGCPYWPSVDNRDRWRHLAWVANGVLEQVGADDDVFIYVESDLAWEVPTMLRLLDHLNRVDVVSPLNMRANGRYYDVWGSKGLDGRRFSFDPPFHPSLASGELTEVQSVAGCTAMIGEVARSTRFSSDDCYLGWNRDMRLAGWKVWCDPTLQVVHP